jgi:subtilisin family serine protease
MTEIEGVPLHIAAIKKAIAPALIAEPLKSKIQAWIDGGAQAGASSSELTVFEVIIELNLDHPRSRSEARTAVIDAIKGILKDGADESLKRNQADATHPYVFARLTQDQILSLVESDGNSALELDVKTRNLNNATADAPDDMKKAVPHRHLRAIFRIWQAQQVYPLTTESIRTIKADAAQISFGANGQDIVWAVLDSGVDAGHPHFEINQNLKLNLPLQHKSFTDQRWDEDVFGHGTHVAGIIAGQAKCDPEPFVAVQSTGVNGSGEYHLNSVAGVRGMAPKCKLLILRVLNDQGIGDDIALIDAIEYIQKLNDYGRNLLVHGVNISAGYWSDPSWYACGQTPICVEVDRLVRSGVSVVVAAGNTGNIVAALATGGATQAGQMMTINDPGNAALAITVGSTHRQKPHLYGISYFSSKGPSSDGRRKPDVVAPGEKIISCASSQKISTEGVLPGLTKNDFSYIEDSGTSMAAPHVSGVLAGFLSVRQEFIGKTVELKEMIMNSATDLGRDRSAQGAGLVDLMRLIQSI